MMAGLSCPRNQLVGRQPALEALRQLSRRSRLVTLVGPPGIGKTRLALEFADLAPSGEGTERCFVDLSEVRQTSHLREVLAAALGVPEPPASPLTDGLGQDRMMEAVSESLRHRPELLILDNCEGVLDGCASVVDQLLKACPHLSVLATSRQPLSVTGELLMTVPPLSLPPQGTLPEPESNAQFESVGLFVARATAICPSFALDPSNASDVVEICRRLDGLPLAIELAAAWVGLLSPRQILARLDERLSFLVTGSHSPGPRHASLGAAVASSYEILSPSEQALLRRMSVFAGGCDVDAVEQVCAGRGLEPTDVLHALTRLVAASLVSSDSTGPEARYCLLETIRLFGHERLREADEEGRTARAHAQWCTELAERSERYLTGSRQTPWLARLDLEAANLASAMRWVVSGGDAELALRIASSLTLYWRVRARFSEGRRWLERALGVDGGPPALQGRATWGVGFMAVMTGDLETAEPLLKRGIAMSEAAGDLMTVARGQLLLGNSRQLAGDIEGARSMLEAAADLARRVDDPWCLAHALALAAPAFGHEDDDVGRACELLLESLEIARQSGDPQSLVFSLLELGGVALARGDLWSAERDLRQAGSVAEATGQVYERVRALSSLAEAALARGDPATTRALASEALTLARRLGSPRAVLVSLVGLARALQADGDLAGARSVFEESMRAARAAGGTCSVVLRSLGQVADASGHHAAACSLVDEALAIAQRTPRRHDVAGALLVKGHLARDEHDRKRAVDLYVDACRLYQTLGCPQGMAPCLEALGGLDVGRFPDRAATLFGAAAQLRKVHGLARFAPDSPNYDADVASVTKRLPSDSFALAWQRGAELSLADAIAMACDRASDEASADWASLTAAERGIIALVTEGLTNAEVAGRLHISPRTVQSHLTHVFSKVGVTSRTALARQASLHGLFSSGAKHPSAA